MRPQAAGCHAETPSPDDAPTVIKKIAMPLRCFIGDRSLTENSRSGLDWPGTGTMPE